MFCREPRIGMREILSQMSPILRQIVLGVQDEYMGDAGEVGWC